MNMIPQELKDLPQWVCWRLEQRGGRKTKTPVSPCTGMAASVADPTTWSTFDEAVKASRNFNGIGFVFTKDDPYCGVDIDGHIDEEMIAQFDSYTERSQSGLGMHIICRAKLPGAGRRREGLEVYDRGRYFIFTGEVIHPEPIRECQEQAGALYQELEAQ